MVMPLILSSDQTGFDSGPGEPRPPRTVTIRIEPVVTAPATP